jgi:excisionase family DNA binding protein
MVIERRRTPNRPLAGGRRITDLAAHDCPHVTVNALAAYLDVSRKTVIKWIDAGTLPAYKFGTEWRINTADALTFVDNARFEPSQVA